MFHSSAIVPLYQTVFSIISRDELAGFNTQDVQCGRYSIESLYQGYQFRLKDVSSLYIEILFRLGHVVMRIFQCSLMFI